MVNFDVTVTNTRPPAAYAADNICGTQTDTFKRQLNITCASPIRGTYIAVRFKDKRVKRILTICEFEVFHKRE